MGYRRHKKPIPPASECTCPTSLTINNPSDPSTMCTCGRGGTAGKNGVRIDCKDPSHCADAEAFGQCRDRPHQLVGLDLVWSKNQNAILCWKLQPAMVHTSPCTPLGYSSYSSSMQIGETEVKRDMDWKKTIVIIKSSPHLATN